MRRIDVSSDRVAYDPRADILFASFGPYDPTCLDHEDSAGDGVYLQYAWPGGELAFIEVWDFSKRYGTLPVTLHVHASEDMDISIPESDYALA